MGLSAHGFRETIENAYVSVDVLDQSLARLCENLKELFLERGISCEMASSQPHISIAYGQGSCALSALNKALHSIAQHRFEIPVLDFEIFEGRRTPYDYLVLKLSEANDLTFAAEIVESQMPCERVAKQMCSHVSLLRFPKGSLEHGVAAEIVSEMNATQAAAFALGKSRCLSGVRVNVFDGERRCCLTIDMAGDSAGLASKHLEYHVA